MSQSTRVPERKLRPEFAVSATSQLTDNVPTIGPAKASATQSSPRGDCAGATMLDTASPVLRALLTGISPLSFWRILPADQFCAADLLEISSTLDEIATVLEGSGLQPALYGDPDAAIALVLSAMPIRKIGLKFDIAMTAVLRCALEDDLRAALVLGHVIDRADLDLRAADLCASWFVHYLRHSPSKSGLTRAEKAVMKALHERERVRTRDDEGRV